VARVECEEPAALHQRAEELGFEWRPAGERTSVWLPQRETLESVAARFHGLPIRALAIHPVSLEDVYREVVDGADRASAADLPPQAADT
jgi:hypothetical protein